MELKRVIDEEEIKRIYQEHLLKDFPEDEVPPWIYFENMLSQDQYECYELLDGGLLIGYACFLRKEIDGKRYYLFDYLAVMEDYRNRGIGAVFLQLLSGQFPNADCMIGEVEDPDAADTEEDRTLRKRRLEFYRRNGFIVTTVKSQIKGVTYCLLEIPTGSQHSAEQIRKIYEAIYISIAPEWFIKKRFIIIRQ